jgi:hypothetical protein
MSFPDSNAQTTQILLRLQYQELARRGADLPAFADVEFKCLSQNGEDGILLYIFSLISATNRRVVEICAGNGIECNAANLIVNHGWHGLLFDGDESNVDRGTAFYSTRRAIPRARPSFVHAWVTAENVNQLIADRAFDGPVDLLSLDLDGNDYWVWKALECIEPRVVVLEFNAYCGPHSADAMSYDPTYQLDLSSQPYRCGASLPAYVKLARAKGYRLVGVHTLGFNAFFVRNGIGEDVLPEKSAQECYEGNEYLRDWTESWRTSILSGRERWETV